MSYTLNKTNGVILSVVQDGSVDLTTNLKFPGRNYAGYGEYQNENFIKLLENFSNTTAPDKAIEGQLWYDTANKQLKIYDVNMWKGIATLDVSVSNPSIDIDKRPSIGDLWYYTAGEQLFAFNGDEYTLIGPPIGADKLAGWRGDYEKDVVQPSVKIYNSKAVIGSEVIAVLSNQEYTLYSDASSSYPLLIQDPPITKLYKGINLSGADSVSGISASVNATNAYTSGTVIWGSAAHAIFANSSTFASSVNMSIYGQNQYQPVSFINTSSLNQGNFSVNYGFTYNAYTNYVKATRFEGVATSALYADLAERYEADDIYPPGTVLVIGGDKEVTEERANTAVAGIVSKNPGYMMNSEAGSDETHPYIALKGRVPCQVVGTILKGDLLVTSTRCGHAEAFKEGDSPNAVIAKALEDNFEGFAVIEVMVV
jgi:hypothetical protein